VNCSEKKQKIHKKVLDTKKTTWYYIKAVRGRADVPCKLNNVKHEQKAPWTILKQKLFFDVNIPQRGL
jgi:hypothetical protein